MRLRDIARAGEPVIAPSQRSFMLRGAGKFEHRGGFAIAITPVR